MSRLTPAALLVAACLAAAPISHASSQDASAPRLLATIPHAMSDASAAPGGKLIAFATSNDVLIVNTQTGESKKVLDGYADIVSWSPAGDRLFAVRINRDDTLCYIWSLPINARTGEPTGDWRRLTVTGSSTPFASPDGKWVAYLRGDCAGPTDSLAIVPVNGGQERVLDGRADDYIGWSPDSRALYYTLRSGGQLVLFKRSLEKASADRIGPVAASWPGVSSDGRHWYAYEYMPKHGRNVVRAYDLSGKEVGITRVPATTTITGWLKSGDEMLAANSARPITMLAIPATGGTPRVLFSASGQPQRQISASPDGRLIAWAWKSPAGPEVWISDAQGGNRRLIDTLHMHNSDFNDVFLVWSPDSQLLAYTAPDARTTHVAAADGRKVTSVTAEMTTAHMEWSADSKRLRYVRHDGTRDARRISVHELSVAGGDREVLKLDMYKDGPILSFIDFDRIFAIRAGVAHSLDGSGAVVRLADSAVVNGAAGWPAQSGDGRLHAFASRRDPSLVRIVSAAGDAPPRQVRLPFTIGNVYHTRIRLDHAGRTLYAIRQPSGTTPSALFRIPLDGGSPSAIYTAPPGDAILAVAPSPDGKTVYATLAGPVTTTLLGVDVGAALRGAAGSR